MSQYRTPLSGAGWRLIERRIAVAPTVDIPAPEPITLPGRGQTAIFDIGPRDAEPIILLHALSCTSLLTWYPSLPQLSRKYRVIGLDQRWHGAGIKSNTFSLEDCADDVAALGTELGFEHFTVAGYSMGSMVGQLVAKRHPDRLTGLVLCATTRNVRRRDHIAFDAYMRVTARMRPRPHRRERPRLSDGGHRWLYSEFRRTTFSANIAAINAIANFNSASWLHELRTRTAVVVMRRDRAIPPRDQRAVARSIPGAARFDVDAGHAGCVFSPEQFVPALTAACDWVHS
ncbi:alpha/beta fold hydrolase [Hoyosella altamirensis]|uniref:3-oxoadipate enol-lactonase n=1 Tax=Hoyosella altamirensis TaxID=616997 RepID=A0A839RQP2_9ACTN|nr:alpha/beta hydrolase [Hoyosella altamirensis]MBB3039302.1 3-oxoadipate enol-lactonase [Hoyosella altamirensis]